MWVLIEESSGKAWSTVHDKNILRAGGTDIEIGEEYKFFYNGGEFSGKALEVDEDRTTLNEQAKALKIAHEKEAKLKRKKPDGADQDVVLPNGNKRRVTPTAFYGQQPSTFYGQQRPQSKPTPLRKPTPPKCSEEEKKRKQILERNKKEAERINKERVLQKLKEQEERDRATDPDFNPGSDDESLELGDQEDDDENSFNVSDKDLLSQVNLKGIQRQGERLNLLKKIQTGGASGTSTETDKRHSPNVMKTPREKELEEELALMKAKLQLSYEANVNNSEDKDAPSDNGVDNKKTQSEGNKSSEGFSKDDSGAFDDDILEDLDDLLGTTNLDYQLYGERPDTSKLVRGYFCKTTILTQALTNATNVNHILRRLMTGVFIPSQIVGCSVTGKSWNAGGKEHAQLTKTPLHPGALEAIVDVANAVAKKKKWPGPKMSVKQCTSIFSHRLGEIRVKVKAGTLKD